jgi:hypothetical protein
MTVTTGSKLFRGSRSVVRWIRRRVRSVRVHVDVLAVVRAGVLAAAGPRRAVVHLRRTDRYAEAGERDGAAPGPTIPGNAAGRERLVRLLLTADLTGHAHWDVALGPVRDC